MAKTNRPLSHAQRQRLVAVYDAKGGNVAATARETGVTIRTAHRWVKRFLAEGQPGLQPRSHARKTNTPKKRLDDGIIERVRHIHQKYPALAYQLIAERLTAKGMRISKSSVHRIVQRYTPIAAAATTPPIIFPRMSVPVALERQLQEASLLLDWAQWREADALALAASTSERAGSERWAQIVLTYCPLARQQAGDATGAEEIIAFVEQTCREAGDYPQALSPPIQALIANRRGWIEDGLLGHFDAAGRLFASAARLSREAGDQLLRDQCKHFRVRVFVEYAMTRADAWLAARPTRPLPAEIAALLDQLLTANEWQEVIRDGNPHHYRFLFNLLALIRPPAAAKLLHDPGSPLATAPTVHLLSQARWCVSEHAWDRAISAAHDAYEAYCALRHPLGIAHAAAIGAHARDRNGLTTRDEMYACLDAWITVLRLHPFPTHPIYQAGRIGLRTALCDSAQRCEQWVSAYAADLRDRVEERDGGFRALDCTDAALGPMPSLAASARMR